MDAKETNREILHIILKHSDQNLRHVKILDKNMPDLVKELAEYKATQQQPEIPDTNEAFENLAEYEAKSVEKLK